MIAVTSAMLAWVALAPSCVDACVALFGEIQLYPALGKDLRAYSAAFGASFTEPTATSPERWARAASVPGLGTARLSGPQSEPADTVEITILHGRGEDLVSALRRVGIAISQAAVRRREDQNETFVTFTAGGRAWVATFFPSTGTGNLGPAHLQIRLRQPL